MFYAGECRKCGRQGEFRVYVSFYSQEKITKAHETDQAMPVYGCHLGTECPVCSTQQRWEPQGEKMLGIKFYAETKPTVVWDRKTPRLHNNHVFSDLGREINVDWKAGFFDWIVYRRNPWITQNTMDKLLHNQYGIRGKVWFTDATPPT